MKRLRRFNESWYDDAMAKDPEVRDSIQEMTDLLGYPTIGHDYVQVGPQVGRPSTRVGYRYFKWETGAKSSTLDLSSDEFDRFASVIEKVRDNVIQAADRLSDRFDVKIALTNGFLILSLIPKTVEDDFRNTI